MEKYFRFDQFSHGYMITPFHEKFTDQMIQGSFSLLPCRLLGISWPDWLRMCEQHGAHLYGKNSRYVCAYWDIPDEKFLEMLNERANAVAAIVDLKNLKY